MLQSILSLLPAVLNWPIAAVLYWKKSDTDKYFDTYFYMYLISTVNQLLVAQKAVPGIQAQFFAREAEKKKLLLDRCFDDDGEEVNCFEQAQERVAEVQEELGCEPGAPCQWYTYIEYREVALYLKNN